MRRSNVENRKLSIAAILRTPSRFAGCLHECRTRSMVSLAARVSTLHARHRLGGDTLHARYRCSWMPSSFARHLCEHHVYSVRV